MKQYWIGSSETKTAKEPKQNTAEVEAERESETKETEKKFFSLCSDSDDRFNMTSVRLSWYLN